MSKKKWLTSNDIPWQWCPSSSQKWRRKNSTRHQSKFFGLQSTLRSRQHMLACHKNAPTFAAAAGSIIDFIWCYCTRICSEKKIALDIIGQAKSDLAELYTAIDVISSWLALSGLLIMGAAIFLNAQHFTEFYFLFFLIENWKLFIVSVKKK